MYTAGHSSTVSLGTNWWKLVSRLSSKHFRNSGRKTASGGIYFTLLKNCVITVNLMEENVSVSIDL